MAHPLPVCRGNVPMYGSVLAICVLLGLSACSGVEFQPQDARARLQPIPRKTAIVVVEDAGTLAQPVIELGTVVRKVTVKPVQQATALADLADQASRYGCDALVAAHEEAVTQGRGGYRWVAKCVRSANFPLKDANNAKGAAAQPPVAAPPPVVAPQDAVAEAKERAIQLRKQAADAERDRKRLEVEIAAAEQDRKRIVAENAAADRAREKAEAANRAAERQEAERKRKEVAATEARLATEAAADQARLAKEAAATAARLATEAAANQARLAQEDAARQKAEGDKLAAVEAVAQRKAAAKQAIEDKTSAAQLDFLAKWPDSEESPAVFAALQRAAVEESANWLSEVKCAASNERLERRMPPPSLQADLNEAKTTRWRSVLPREVGCTFTVRNPTALPVVVDVDLPGGHTHRFLTAKQSGTVKESLRCQPEGLPQKTVTAGLVEYTYACALAGPTRVVGLRPATAELAVDKRAGDPLAPLETLAKVWQSLPGTRLGQVYIDLIGERLRRLAEDVGPLNGKLTVLQKPVAGTPTPVRVAFKNTSGRDVTVLYTVGTGRDERLLLPKGGAQEVMLKTLANLEADLRVIGVLPKLRSMDWLVGSWQLGAARLVILPTANGGLAAFALVNDADGMRRAVPAMTETVGGVVTFKATVGGTWLGALLGQVPTACATACEAEFTLKLSDQELYTIGGPRVLVVTVAAGGSKAMAKLTDD